MTADHPRDSPRDQPRAHVRYGFAGVRPYLYGTAAVWTLVRDAFDAVELGRHQFAPHAAHLEARIDDGVVVLEISDPPHAHATIASVQLYVRDVDAVHRRALAAGATEVRAPADQPYGERVAGVRDQVGNIWWISAVLPGDQAAKGIAAPRAP